MVAAEDGLAVRTAFSPQLTPAAMRWTRGASAGPPQDFALSPGGLRLWAIAAGHRDDVGFLLAPTSGTTRSTSWPARSWPGWAWPRSR